MIVYSNKGYSLYIDRSFWRDYSGPGIENQFAAYKYGNGSEYQNLQRPKDSENWWSNFGTALRLTAGWAFYFGGDETFNNDKVARSLMNSRIVEEGRDFWFKKVNLVGRLTAGVTDFAGTKRFGGGNFGFTGLFKAGIDPIEQFIGSTHDFSITSDGKSLTYTITNVTSFKSLMYGITPEWMNFYNTSQTYIFREPIDFNRVK